jgi:hypothetical protein
MSVRQSLIQIDVFIDQALGPFFGRDKLAEMAEGGEPALVGLTRQQAESMLGGVARSEEE